MLVCKAVDAIPINVGVHDALYLVVAGFGFSQRVDGLVHEKAEDFPGKPNPRLCALQPLAIDHGVQPDVAVSRAFVLNLVVGGDKGQIQRQDE